MRIRAQHFVLIIGVVVIGFVVLVVYTAARPGVDSTDDADEFLEKLHESTPATVSSTAGLLPSIDADPSLVPKMEVETTEMDMGVIPADKVTQTRLKVYNRGRKPLIIGEIKTSCICTQGIIPPERATIQPGTESYIDVAVNPRLVPGFYSQKTLTIASNDPQDPQMQVRVKANIEPEFSLESEELDFGEVLKGETPQKTVRLRQLREAPMVVTGVRPMVQEEGMLPDMECSFVQVPEAEWKSPGKVEYDITLRLLSNLPLGDFSRFAIIESDIERMPQFHLAVTARITAPYIMEPAPPKMLVIREGIGGSDGKSATAFVSCIDSPVQIENVQSKEGKLLAEVRPTDSPNAVQLVISLPPDATEGRLDDEFTFTIKTNKGEFSEKLTVRGYVRGSEEAGGEAGSAPPASGPDTGSAQPEAPAPGS